ncbi:MAG: sulfatase [Eubacteriales bacterium]|jgi:arylsulfatase A-like enzyme
MKAILLMFDTLNRRMLSPYGCDWTHTPNFQRLAERTVVFDNSYVGSLPCMPARRELHTGRHNFLHRVWGPLEPFDDSMVDILRHNGVYTHLVSDHYHYWEDGGATYHTRYNTWEFNRGQEGDPWKGEVAVPQVDLARNLNHRDTKERKNQLFWQDVINRKYLDTEQKQPQTLTFDKGLEFMRTNSGEDNWFLQIETFDPHEPYFTQETYKKLYPHDYDGPTFDWPEYGPVTETDEQKQHVRYEYAALLSMCDHSLGRFLDAMDELSLWEDTLLIVCTDHGFLLGEHDWWGKSVPPFYNEECHTPLFIWDPRRGCRGERRQALVQWIDFAPTLLRYFDLPVPPDMQGHDLRDTIAQDVPVRKAALYGANGGQVCVTDGRYTYLRGPARPDNQPLYTYTLMPMHMFSLFTPQELSQAEWHPPFSFTKGCHVMKIPSKGRPHQPINHHRFGNLLFDLQTDPYQNHPLQDEAVEKMMIDYMVELMMWNDAPEDQYERMGLWQEFREHSQKKCK